MPRLVVATTNQGKIVEIADIVKDLGFKVLCLGDLESPPTVVEDADTFVGNATKKAITIRDAFSCPVIADDSGLCVDALGGAPGVYSARYGGPGLDDAGRVAHLLETLHGVPVENRTASFQCAIAYAVPNCDVQIFEGTLRGSITLAPAGTGGFGYDPVFLPHQQAHTMAQLGLDLKKQISHRAKALEAFSQWLENNSNMIATRNE